MKLMKFKLSCLANLRKLRQTWKRNKSELMILGAMFVFSLLFFRESKYYFGIDLNNLIPIIFFVLSLLNLLNGNPLLKIRYQDLANKCLSFRTFKYKTILQLVLGRCISYFLMIMLFDLSKTAQLQLVISLAFSYSVCLYSVLQYNMKYASIMKGILLILPLLAYLTSSIILIIILDIFLTLIWTVQKKYSYTELFHYYMSYESLREGMLTRDNISIQSAQSEMFDKKSKAQFTIIGNEYHTLNRFYFRYEITNFLRKGKRIIVLYLTMMILYFIKTALNLPENCNLILMLFTIGSIQLLVYNQKAEEDHAVEKGYYFRYPVKILLKTKYVAIVMIAFIPFMFYWTLFNFSVMIILIFLYMPLQITCGYFLKNKLMKVLLNIPILLMISVIIHTM